MKTTYAERFQGNWVYMRLPFMGIMTAFLISHVGFFGFIMIQYEVWRQLFDIEVAALVLLWAFVPLVVLISLTIYNYNIFPRLWVADEGLYVQFNLQRIFVPWADIVKFEKHWNMGDSYVIYAKKITGFHYFYGLAYFKFLPAIYTDPFMAKESKKKLVSIIERNLPATS